MPQIKTSTIIVGAGIPTVDDDSNKGYQIGQLWEYNNNYWRCLNDTPGAAVWFKTTAGLANATQLYLGVISFSMPLAYTDATAPFTYEGSTAWGTLNTVRIITKQSSGGGKTHDVRIWDNTNLVTVAELIGSSHLVYTEITLPVTAANVPVNQALFTVQVRRVGGGNNLDIGSITMEVV